MAIQLAIGSLSCITDTHPGTCVLAAVTVQPRTILCAYIERMRSGMQALRLAVMHKC